MINKVDIPGINAVDILTTPVVVAVIEYRMCGICMSLAWSTGRRNENTADLECIHEFYTDEITVAPIVGAVPEWRYPGETEWRR